jgi:hypothetical protein
VIQSAANAPQPRDLYLPTTIQAIGTLVMAFATGGLVWATVELVKATKRLTEVGEHTWKSNLKPKIWAFFDEGIVGSDEAAQLKIRNACGVDLVNVRVASFQTAFWLDSKNEYVCNAALISEMPENVKLLGDLKVQPLYMSYNLWNDAIQSLDFTTKHQDRINMEVKPEDGKLVAGLIVSISFTQSVTNERFNKVIKIAVEDAGKASLRIWEILSEEAKAV